MRSGLRSKPSPPTSTLAGVIVESRCRKEASGWSLLKVRVDRSKVPEAEQGAISADGLVVAHGVIASYRINDEFVFSGDWIWSTKGPDRREFKFVQADLLRPHDARGIASWLEERLHWVGPARAKQLVDLFGSGPNGLEGFWNQMDTAGSDVSICNSGICSLTQAQELLQVYRSAEKNREVEAWLRSLGVGPATAASLLASFGENVRQQLERDPYVVMELDRFGFLRSDSIAQALGISRNHGSRARAAIIHCLQEAADGDGHCYLPLATPLEVERQPSFVAKRKKNRSYEHPGAGLLDRLEHLDIPESVALQQLRALDAQARKEMARGEEGKLEAALNERVSRRRKLMVLVDPCPVEEGEGRVYSLPVWEDEREAAQRARKMLEGGTREVEGKPMVKVAGRNLDDQIVGGLLPETDENEWASLLGEER